jgi:hypothetical protein
MHDPIYQFDILTTAEFSCDIPQNFDIRMKNFVFLWFSGNFKQLGGSTEAQVRRDCDKNLSSTWGA